jgi:putative spermidine/putrescine transport system permease protein
VAFLGFISLSDAGLLARFAYHLGLLEATTDFPSLINDRWGIGIVTAHVFMASPFLTLYFASLYRSERVEELRELAGSLGLAPKQQFVKLVMPLLLRRGRATLGLYSMFVFSSYEIPLLLGSQEPAMYAVLTIRKLQRFNLADVPQAYVMSVCYAIFMLLGLLLWRSWKVWHRRAAVLQLNNPRPGHAD